MNRVGIRELRNNASRVVRRAMAGERIVITVDGVPAAQLGPLNDGQGPAGVDDLVVAGLLRGPRTTTPPPPPGPARAPSGRSSTEVLREQRER